MVSSLDSWVDRELDQIACQGLQRHLRLIQRLEGCVVSVDGTEAVSFASCDYLGLSDHPRLVDASCEAARAGGTSIGSARLLAGQTDEVAALEEDLARAFGMSTALVFGSGYLANVGVVTALAGPGDLLISDRLNHASMIDACRLSGAEVHVVDHNDVSAMEEALEAGSNFRRVLVLIEGLYSVDGDQALIERWVDHATAAKALIIVDDAHGLGTIGPGGSGTAKARGVVDQIAVQVGNLGKALGSYGAFALMDQPLRELFVQTSRPFMFTCALPPPVVAAARAGVAVFESEPERVERLATLSKILREALAARGVPGIAGEGPIVPVHVGDPERAVALSHALLQRGWLVPAVRPPTVPERGSRLRLAVTARHEEQHCVDVAEAVASLLEEGDEG